MPYAPDEYRAQHIEGCRLDPDHAGACLLARPFRIAEDGGRVYSDEQDLSDTLDAHHGAATAADRPPLLDSTDAAAAEVRWVASEARALMSDPDPERRARFLVRKRALLHYIERTTT